MPHGADTRRDYAVRRDVVCAAYAVAAHDARCFADCRRLSMLPADVNVFLMSAAPARMRLSKTSSRTIRRYGGRQRRLCRRTKSFSLPS